MHLLQDCREDIRLRVSFLFLLEMPAYVESVARYNRCKTMKAGDSLRRISKKALSELREKYPQGARVELVKMTDPYNTKLVPGSQGTVRCVDDIGTIHVDWDCGSRLGVVYREDICHLI